MGFPMRCDLKEKGIRVPLGAFQSLMGFPMRCDSFQCHTSGFPLSSFQSLMGFPMRCDGADASLWNCHAQVSIPYGFSNALRPAEQWSVPAPDTMFQSLMGFPMRCDTIPGPQFHCAPQVSIPYGFSNALRLHFHCAPMFDHGKFQSLMGFPMRCDASSRFSLHAQGTGFNPLWVFQCAATEISCWPIENIPFRFNPLWVFQCAATKRLSETPDTRVQMFQSLMGFPMRCDLAVIFYAYPRIAVSIPYGFSNALRPTYRNGVLPQTMMFQSLMGFPMRCDPWLDFNNDTVTVFQSLMGFPMRCDRLFVFLEKLD